MRADQSLPNCQATVAIDPSITLLQINRGRRQVPMNKPITVNVKIESLLAD